MISLGKATDTRLRLSKLGYRPIPFKEREKRPAIKGWTELPDVMNEKYIYSWEVTCPSATGTGIVTGDVVVLDIDISCPKLTGELKTEIKKEFGLLPPERIGNSPKTAFFFRSEQPMKKRVSKKFGTEFVQDQQVEVLGGGQCVVTHNIHPSTGELYTWPDGDLVNFPRKDLPLITPFQVDQLISKAEIIMSSAGLVSKQDLVERERTVFTTMKSHGYDEISSELMSEMMDYIPNNDCDYDDWIRIGMGLNDWGGANADKLFETWSAKSPKNVPKFTQSKFKDCANPHSITVGTVVHKAMNYGFRFPKRHGKVVVDLLSGAKENQVYLHPGELHSSVNQIEHYMSDSDLDFYQFNDRLIEVIRLPSQNEEARDYKIVTHDRATLRDRLGLVARLYKYSKKTKGWYRVDAPSEILDALLSRGINSRLKPLRTLATTPYLSPLNELVVEEGYDPKSKIHLAYAGCMPAKTTTHKSKKAAIDSLTYLKDLVSDFPFKSEIDESVALACLIAATDRVNLDNIPLTAFNAPTAGTGKSLLVDIISITASGKAVSVLAQGKDEAETEKRLNAAMLHGDPLISIDNVEHPLGGDTLCQILTQPTLRIRPLGVSKLIDIEKTCLIAATGNNIEISGDAVRRSLICTLDAGVERPEKRSFSYDARERAKKHRHEIVSHSLTIIRSYLSSEAPAQEIPLGSFERWSRRIRDPLLWLGAADPCASQDSIRQNDGKLEAQTELLKILYNSFQADTFKAREIEVRVSNIDRVAIMEHLTLLGCLPKGKLEPTLVGRLFKKLEGRIMGGLLLCQSSRSGGTVTWSVTASSRKKAEVG